MNDDQIMATEQELRDEAARLTQVATRLDSDLYGNPRYYLPTTEFRRNGRFYRPKFAKKYRGKQFGEGWVFSSYSLVNDLFWAIRD